MKYIINPAWLLNVKKCGLQQLHVGRGFFCCTGCHRPSPSRHIIQPYQRKLGSLAYFNELSYKVFLLKHQIFFSGIAFQLLSY